MLLSSTKYSADYVITMDDIIREGHPILRSVTEPVQLPLQDTDREALQCMMQFLKNSKDPEASAKHKLRSGIGLSANQIGLQKRMFVMYLKDDKGKIVEHTSESQDHQPFAGDGVFAGERGLPVCGPPGSWFCSEI